MLHNLRYLLRLLVTFLLRFKGVIVSGAVVGILIFLFFGLIGPKVFNRTTSKIGISGRYHVESLPKNILGMIGQGLTVINDRGEVEPGLADKWETPDKGKTWIFHLKKGVFWQDKTNVKSEDISYNFSDVTIERPDEFTIIFKLKDKYSPFPSVVSLPVFKKGLLGTGEWKVKKIVLSGSFVQELIVEKGKEKIIFRFYPTEENAKTALKLGKVERLQDIFNPESFVDWHTLDIQKTPKVNTVVTLFFNTEDPKLSEKNLRQALFYAVDKKTFDGPRAISPISPNSWAYNPQVKQYNFDPERAKQIIKDLPEEVKKDLAIKLVSSPLLLPVAEKISQDWRNIGVESTILVSSVIPQDFQMYLAILDIPSDPDQYSIWHSTQSSTNIANYKNPRIDKLLEDGRSELDLEERRKIYLDFQRYLLEDLPAAFLYHPYLYEISKRE